MELRLTEDITPRLLEHLQAGELDLVVASLSQATSAIIPDSGRTVLRTFRDQIRTNRQLSNVRAGEFAAAGITPEPLLLLGRLVRLHLRVDVDEQDAWRVEPRAKAFARVRGNPSQQTTLEVVRFEPYVVPKRSLTGGSAERVDTRLLQVIYRFRPDGFPIHVGQQMDGFIEAPPISEITRKKLEISVPNSLARSSHN